VSLLEVKGVNAHYGPFQALFQMDLKVEEGGTIAVIGANGAGKSTLLKVISGVMPCSAGEVLFDGVAVHGLRGHERVAHGISLVPEGRRIFPSLSVHENLLVGGWVKRPGPWTPDKVYELFPLLVKRRDQRAGTLSGGEQQALAIGRGLMSNPRLLLLDEASLGLAPIVVRSLYKAMPAIVQEGTTLLVVEQDIGQAVSVADRVYCLLEGRVVLSGSPAELTREQISAAYFGVRRR
jgi:branched-chain amino acid transport system ATP-binding protein